MTLYEPDKSALYATPPTTLPRLYLPTQKSGGVI